MDKSILKHQKCAARNVSTCNYHSAMREMIMHSAKRNVQDYVKAKKQAEDSSRDSESFFPGFSLVKRVQKAQERLALVEAVHQQCDKNFVLPDPNSIVVYRAEPEDSNPALDVLTQAFSDVYAEQGAFDSLEIENAYTQPGFGSDAVLLHVFDQPVDANLVGFTPSSTIQEYVIRRMVEAVIDQWHLVKIDRGLQPDPVKLIVERTGQEIIDVKSRPSPDLPEDYPEDLRESALESLEGDSEAYDKFFNEGWLYSFYKAVERAKDPERFAHLSDASNVGKNLAIEEFVRGEYEYWTLQWQTHGVTEKTPSRQQAFFDGAATCWDRWIEDLSYL